MNRDAVYRRLPRALQHVAVSAAGLEIRLRRYDRRFDELLRGLCERESWSEERLAAFRGDRLRAYLIAAEAASPYYRELFASTGLDPRARDAEAEVRERLPVL